MISLMLVCTLWWQLASYMTYNKTPTRSPWIPTPSTLTRSQCVVPPSLEYAWRRMCLSVTRHFRGESERNSKLGQKILELGTLCYIFNFIFGSLPIHIVASCQFTMWLFTKLENGLISVQKNNPLPYNNLTSYTKFQNLRLMKIFLTSESSFQEPLMSKLKLKLKSKSKSWVLP